MSDFEGFSEVSLLYAEKHDLVRQMTEIFASERKQLLDALEAKVVAAPWFDRDRLAPYRTKRAFEVRLRKPSSDTNLAGVYIYLDASRLGRRSLYSHLSLHEDVPDMNGFRRSLEATVAREMPETTPVGWYSASGRASYLVRRSNVPFELETLLDTMFAEVENLQQLFPYVEKVYLDLERE